MAGWREGDLQEDSSTGANLNGSPAKAAVWSRIVRRTYQLYWEKFGVFFRIALPPALIAYLYQFVHHALVLQLRANGLAPPHSAGASFLVLAFTLLEGALYWIISGFFFAAVAAHVLHEPGTDESSIADDFSLARQRLGAVVVTTLLIWAVFNLGRGILGFAVVIILERLQLLQNWTVSFIAFSLPLLLVAGLVSRLGLAIPVLVEEPEVSVSQAVRKSIAKTENWEFFFMAFLAKSALLGYGAYWLVNLGLDWLWQHTSIDASGYTWVQGIVYISIAAMLEPALFIAFSLLHREPQPTHEEALPSAVG